MATLDFFRNVLHEDPNFFDEGPSTASPKPNQFITGTFPVATWTAATPQHAVFPQSADGQATNGAQRVRFNVLAKQAQGELLAFEGAQDAINWSPVPTFDRYELTSFAPQDDGASTSFTFDVTNVKYFRVRLDQAFLSGSKGNLSLSLISGSFNVDGIDTSEIDGYRQGVELTQQKHFDAGLAKIHAGEPGHVLRRNRYGMDKNFRTEAAFEELDYFDPVNFLRAQELDSPLFNNIITFPIITSDNDQIENYVFDGVIEPLTIRAKASFFSIEVPFEAHEVKGAVMGGNTDTTYASDQVQTVYLYDLKQQIGFLDQYADGVAFAEQEASTAHASSIVGFFLHEKPQLAPFVDARYPRNASLSTNYDSAMDAALSLMTGSTEGYINLAIGKRSAPSGWDYDTNSGVGTDSLSFGGMVY